jgi:polar amino acid transport system substrate-binding protein
VALRNAAPETMQPETLEGRTIGVQQNSAHEAYLRAYFKTIRIQTYPSLPDLLAGLKKNEVNIIFADGVSMSQWLNGADADGCCVFRDGPFGESRYFGEGAGIAVGKQNMLLRDALNYALGQVTAKGVHADLYLKYFPIGFY